MAEIIINGDDFGLTKGVNRGIIEACKNGILTSTTMLVNGREVEDAIEISKAVEELSIGIHLALTTGTPILSDLKKIVNKDGDFYKLSEITENPDLIDIEELEREWRAQIEKFIRLVGKKPSHIDSHHHVHADDVFGEKSIGIKKIIRKFMREYNLPIRAFDNTEVGYRSPKINCDFYGENVKQDFFKENLHLIKSSKLLELMVHPAFIDKELMDISSYNMIRAEELKILTSDNVKLLLEKEDIKVISYADIKIK